MLKISSLFILSVLFLSGCTSTRFLPDDVDNQVKLGMSQDNFTELKGDKAKKSGANEDFRNTFLEKVTHENIEFFGYYFDTDGDKPLYEIIIGYKTEELANKTAIDLLGKPNYKEKEWKIERKNDYTILAWVFKKKLVIVSLIPDTEWYDEFK